MYDAEVRNLDFRNPKSVDIINQWCSDKTNKRITEIISEINPNARLFLMNALYFKGTWVNSFDKTYTVKEDFTALSGSKSKVDMMNQEATFNYTEEEDFQLAELPYGNEAFSMVVMLPNEDKTPDDIIAKLNASNWELWNNRLSRNTLRIKLPKFKLEYERDLKDDLKDMGMIVPFNEREADFTNMGPDLFIGLVKQKTFVEVNEEGTEAAAVTIVGMETNAGPGSYTIPFHVNRPFIYLIKEKSTGVILFMGKVGSL